MLGPKMEELTERWRKLHDEELHNVLVRTCYQDNDMEVEMGGTRSMHEGSEKCVENLSRLS